MKRYKPSAGRCDKCGYWKTWGFKVENPKTGNMMPGHIDEDGHKLGNGECPYYADPDFQKPAFITASELPTESGIPGGKSGTKVIPEDGIMSESGTWMCQCTDQKCILIILNGYPPERCIHHGGKINDGTWEKVK